MRLVVGLGNPGPKYAANRHNVGFLAVNAIVRRHSFGPFKSRFQGLIAEGTVEAVRLHILKPMTFMNESGRALGEVVRFYKLAPSEVLVIHDELDLAPGKVKVKQGGGSAGHNGLRSIDAHIGPDYWRLRIGIGHPGDPNLVYPYVLSDFFAEDVAWLEKLLPAIAEALPLILAGEDNRFMTKLALLTKPQRPKPPPQDAGSDAAKDGPGPGDPAADPRERDPED
ncbi:MAG TPA: aminoacyl-tRNA hydrolase [Alphaproteobacteria bacterium]|nr:aminoacyl-tRNA hydrolase [Alphaproteobacteria bacterium]